MRNALIAALGLAFAAPAFAAEDATHVKADLKDGAKDTGDAVQDALHTDKGVDKAIRHTKRDARHMRRKARHIKRDLTK